MKIINKVSSSIVLAGLMMVVFSTTAEAKLSKPTFHSHSNLNTVIVNQETKTVSLVGVDSYAGTGKNLIKGVVNEDPVDPSITTGDAKSKVNVLVAGGSNEATVNPCGCLVPVEDSCGKPKGGSSNLLVVNQSSNVFATTFVESNASTGGNKIVGTTNGEVSINTGDATSKVNVVVTGGSNSLNTEPSI